MRPQEIVWFRNFSLWMLFSLFIKMTFDWISKEFWRFANVPYYILPHSVWRIFLWKFLRQSSNEVDNSSTNEVVRSQSTLLNVWRLQWLSYFIKPNKNGLKINLFFWQCSNEKYSFIQFGHQSQFKNGIKLWLCPQIASIEYETATQCNEKISNG